MYIDEISVFQHSCRFDLQLIYAVIISFIIKNFFFLEKTVSGAFAVMLCGC